MSKLIGEGSVGDIHSPPLRCDNVDEYEYDESYISKLMKPEAAEDEIANMKIIDKLDPDGTYHIPMLRSCKSRKEDRRYEDRDSLIIYPYGGIDLSQYSKKDSEIKNLSFIRNFINLFRGLHKMNKNQFYHFDIKPDNILVLEENETYKFRYIDFGISEHIPDTEGYEAWQFTHSYYPQYPRESAILSYPQKLDEFTELYDIQDYKREILNRLDVFSLGRTFGKVLNYHSVEILLRLRSHDLLHKELKALAGRMIDPILMNRPTAKEAYRAYYEILKQFNMLN